MAKAGYGDLKHLKPLHLRAIDLLISGMTTTEAAKAVGVSAQGMSSWKASPKFQEEWARRSAERGAQLKESDVAASVRAQKILDDASVLAAQKLVDICQRGDDKTAMAAAEMILERTVASKNAAASGFVINAEVLQMFQNVCAESDSIRPRVVGSAQPTVEKAALQYCPQCGSHHPGRTCDECQSPLVVLPAKAEAEAA